jgi:hypothetical protein
MQEETNAQNAPDEFAAALGEPIERVLDLDTWHVGADLATLYAELNQAVAESVEQDKRTHNALRAAIIPRLRDGSDRTAPHNAGLYQITAEEVAEIHGALLFNGATECCDGTVASHDSLLLSVVQIGLALVAYQGSQGTWVQRLYRRDLRAHYPDPVQEAIELLRRRGQRDADNVEETNDPLSRLIRRTLMEYAERAALADLSTACWRMGHGNPVPTGMLLVTGGSAKALLKAGMDVLRRLLLQHRRFVYVVSEPADRLLLTLGNALHPLEFAIFETLTHQFERLQERIQSRGAAAERAEVVAFMQEVGPQIVTGVYRAGRHSPARVFYAHKDFACEAAALAIADSVLQPYRGFPMLIDLADIVCGNTFDQASFNGSVQNAYARAGEPTRYLGERETRS